jgi:V/A-type H+-transporting ATPase subunit B
VRRLSAIIGEEGLNEADQRVLDFANAFEGRFVGQGHTNRPIEETLELGWELLADFPPERLKRVSTELQEEYMP